jgi:hypothetical protein
MVMKNTALKSIFLALCLFLLPLILEAQTLPDWVENPPRYIGDIVYIVMKGTGKTLPEAQGRASWDTETSSFSPNLGLFTFERNVGGNRFLLSLFWSNDWFNNNALLIEDFYTQNGEEIEYYVLYSLPRAVYNVLDDVVYQYIPAFKAGTFENAIYLAANQLAQEVPRNIKVAVIGFASADKELGEFVLEETTGYLSSAGTMSLFDRKSLDSIRTEQGFQMTGDVDDESAVSIGQFAGVDVVITGSITGSGSTRRLRFKALDVKTGAVVSQTSHRY